MNILGEVCMKKRLSFLLSIIIVLSICAPLTSVMAEEARKQSALKTGKEIAALCNEYDNYNELDSTDEQTINTRLIVKSDDKIEQYDAIDSVYGFGYVFLQYADENNAEKALHNYENSGYIVSYDSLANCTDSANHQEWGDNWSYERVDSDSALDYYKLKAKPTINIAVVDSGINYNHELFKNRITRTKFNSSASGEANNEIDDYGHGTEVAGVIANSTPSNVKISSYKVMDSKGYGSSSTIVAACSYIEELNNKPDIINFSLGLKTGVIIESVIDELVNQGITVVAAAGNDNREVFEAPGKCESAITVAAFDYYNKPCSFTNYGQVVDISAPGEYIYTADMSKKNAYTFSLGTSLATPFVSAAAAYVLMENRKYTPQQVKQELIDTAMPFKKSSCFNLYGAGMVNFSNIINGSRCKDVTTNYQSGVYREDISVELKCANTLVDIYYTTDGTLPTKERGTKYTEPIAVTDSTRIIAAAFARAGTSMHSKFTSLDYYILKNNEPEYIVDRNGSILNYLGSDTDLVVPDSINGIQPTSISQKCFWNQNINSIKLPDSVTDIEKYAFYGTELSSIEGNNVENINECSFYECEKLSNIKFPELRYIGKQSLYGCNTLSNIDLSNVKEIGSEALYGCKSLPKQPDFSSVDWVAEKGLAGTYFSTIHLPNCTRADDNAFDGCTAEEIVLNKAKSIGSNAFNNCKNLKVLYVPNAQDLSGRFNGCSNLNMIFAPKATYITLSIPNNTTIYCSDKLTGVDFFDDYKDYKYTFISPEYTPGLNEADRDGYTDRFIRVESDKFAQSKGGQIRTRDNGLRFGFEFDENNIAFDFKKYAENIDYGFVYTFDSYENKNDFQKNYYLRANRNNVFVKSANKRNVEGTVSTYNAVFTGITKDHYNNEITARAYVNIDGMYFYSPVITRSYSSASNADDYVGIEEADNDIVFVHEHSFVKSVIAPKCEEKGYTLYKCAKCNESYTENYVDALGHNYKFVSADNSKLTYKCSDCDSTVTKTKSELPIFIDYVNTKAVRGNDNMYLDLNKDGYINAKDYALLNKISN